MSTVKAKLQEIVELDIIERVEEPTRWCYGMVGVQTPNGGVRICRDLTELNEFVEREVQSVPVTEQVLVRFAGAQDFFKVDANSGFCQFDLAEESRNMTTLLRPFGRYPFKSLLFGTSSAPEFF